MKREREKEKEGSRVKMRERERERDHPNTKAHFRETMKPQSKTTLLNESMNQ